MVQFQDTRKLITFSLRLRCSMLPQSDASPINVKLLALSVDIMLKRNNQQVCLTHCSHMQQASHSIYEWKTLYRAGGMYFLDTPSCLFSTNASWKEYLTVRHIHLTNLFIFLKVVTVFIGVTSLDLPLSLAELRFLNAKCVAVLPPLVPTPPRSSPPVYSVSLWLTVLRRDVGDIVGQKWTQDLFRAKGFLYWPVSSWTVTRSRTLKDVSSLSGWQHRWHTKLTCIVVLDDLDTSIVTTTRHALTSNTTFR